MSGSMWAKVAGAWEKIYPPVVLPPVPLFNDATGGTETTVANYNGTGETWKVHEFAAGGTFDVTAAVEPFTVLTCGGGGGGGGSNNAAHGGAGGGGRAASGPQTLTVGALTVTVGTGGGGGGGNGSGGNGNPSSLAAVQSSAGGTGGPPNMPGGTGGAGGGANLSDRITGTLTTYGADAPVFNAGGGAGASGPGGGGGPAQVGTNSGGAGQTGRVIIAYRIG